MKLPKGVEEDHIGVDFTPQPLKLIPLFSRNKRNGEGLGEIPPNILNGGELVYSGYDSGGRRVEFYVENPPLRSWETEEWFPGADSCGHSPGHRGLSKGSSCPKKGNPLPDNVWVD